MSSSVRDKIIGYLAAGVSQSAAAQAAGVSDGYVSQLLELEEVREAVAVKKAGRLEQAIEVDAQIEHGEKLALQQIVRKLGSPLTPLKEAVQAFSVLNSARKKADEGAGNQAGAVDTITIVLPRAAKTMIQINTDNQIIEVNGRTTAPLPSKALPAMAKQLGGPKVVELPHVQDVRSKSELRDQEKAQQVLADITTVIDGVQVVI